MCKPFPSFSWKCFQLMNNFDGTEEKQWSILYETTMPTEAVCFPDRSPDICATRWASASWRFFPSKKDMGKIFPPFSSSVGQLILCPASDREWQLWLLLFFCISSGLKKQGIKRRKEKSSDPFMEVYSVTDACLQKDASRGKDVQSHVHLETEPMHDVLTHKQFVLIGIMGLCSSSLQA